MNSILSFFIDHWEMFVFITGLFIPAIAGSVKFGQFSALLKEHSTMIEKLKEDILNWRGYFQEEFGTTNSKLDTLMVKMQETLTLKMDCKEDMCNSTEIQNNIKAQLLCQIAELKEIIKGIEIRHYGHSADAKDELSGVLSRLSVIETTLNERRGHSRRISVMEIQLSGIIDGQVVNTKRIFNENRIGNNDYIGPDRRKLSGDSLIVPDIGE